MTDFVFQFKMSGSIKRDNYKPTRQSPKESFENSPPAKKMKNTELTDSVNKADAMAEKEMHLQLV